MFNEQVNTRTDHIHTAQNPEILDIPAQVQLREDVLRKLLVQLDKKHPGEAAAEVGLTRASHVYSGVQVFQNVQMAHGFGVFISACVAGRGFYTSMTCA